jgi:glycosyltransferase involved in cell wall biosynthesis
MRVLILHSRYLSGESSGENQVVDSEAALLAGAGHDVQVWAPESQADGPMSRVRAGFAAVHSRAAVRHVRQLVRRHGSEVVHCHNLFPVLSPSVLRAAADEGAAVVMTLHNYRLICLPATFLRDGSTCELCLGRLPWRGVVHACYRGSRPGSAALAASIAGHRVAGTFARVHRFLAVSRFVRDKYLQAGVSGDRLVVKPNFVPDPRLRRSRRDYHLYLGRLSPEKGVATVLAAHRPGHGRLLIAGDGPAREELRAQASRDVEFVGPVRTRDVPALLARARSLLLPSRSYEGAPRVVLEAYASGVPVIASRIGGLREVVDHGGSGLLVDAEDPNAWAAALARLADDDVNERMGAAARGLWEERYGPREGLRALEAAYEAALAAADNVSNSTPPAIPMS